MRGARTCRPSRRSARAYARFLIKQGRARDALPYYREALDAVDRLFANTRGLDESVREGFLAQYTNYYQEMTELLLRSAWYRCNARLRPRGAGGGVAHAARFSPSSCARRTSAGFPWIPRFWN